MSFISKLALTIGTAASLVAVAAPASARPYFGGGYGGGYHGRSYGGYGGYGGYGYRGYGGYGGGYRHRDNSGAIVAGALLLGGLAAVAASSNHRDYDDRYRNDGYYRGTPAPVYSAPPRGAYEGGYYDQRSYDNYGGYGY